MLPRPGDLTVPFAGGPIQLYQTQPVDDVIQSGTYVEIDRSDGLLFVLAHLGKWLFVLTSTRRLGWVYRYDVGPSDFSGAVYHIE